jgi:hypothetical protein
MFYATFYINNLSNGKNNKTSAREKDYINGNLMMSLSEGLFERQSADCILQIKEVSENIVVIETLKNPSNTYILKTGQQVKIENNNGNVFKVKILSIQPIVHIN